MASRTKYACVVISLSGKTILCGPYYNRDATYRKRYKVVMSLKKKNQAREFDLKFLEQYEQGRYFD